MKEKYKKQKKKNKQRQKGVRGTETRRMIETCMTETRRFKNVVIFIQTILSFVLSRKITNIFNSLPFPPASTTLRN